MVARHHQRDPVGLKEEEHHSNVSGNAEFKSVPPQATQADPRMRVRFAKGIYQLVKALIYFLKFRICSAFRPAPPTWADFNREGF